MTHRQEIQIGILQVQGWRRDGQAIKRDGERIPLFFHPFSDFRFCVVERDGRIHFHGKRTPLRRAFEERFERYRQITCTA